MKNKAYRLAFTLSLALLLAGNAHAEIISSEAELNAPVEGSVEDSSVPMDEELTVAATYQLPAFHPAWGLPRAMYQKMVRYYQANRGSIPNGRYVMIADFNQHSGKRRFYLFDLRTGKVERHLVAHGAGSDTNNDGYATRFSNVQDSRMSSLGFYLTGATYTGKHGYSLRLRGLSSTNSNAMARAVVMHPADYVRESAGTAGRSWGCPALDPRVSPVVINKVRGGALLLIDR